MFVRRVISSVSGLAETVDGSGIAVQVAVFLLCRGIKGAVSRKQRGSLRGLNTTMAPRPVVVAVFAGENSGTYNYRCQPLCAAPVRGRGVGTA